MKNECIIKWFVKLSCFYLCVRNHQRTALPGVKIRRITSSTFINGFTVYKHVQDSLIFAGVEQASTYNKLVKIDIEELGFLDLTHYMKRKVIEEELKIGMFQQGKNCK